MMKQVISRRRREKVEQKLGQGVLGDGKRRRLGTSSLSLSCKLSLKANCGRLCRRRARNLQMMMSS